MKTGSCDGVKERLLYKHGGIVKLYTEKLNRRAEEIPLTTQTTHQQAPDNRHT